MSMKTLRVRIVLKGWDRLPAQYPARLRDTVIIELKKLELEAKVNPPVSAERPIHQTVFGNVGQMAGRDMNTNVTVVALLGALEKAIQESPEIPENEKGELLSKIRDLSSNPWVVALGTGGLLEILKALV